MLGLLLLQVLLPTVVEETGRTLRTHMRLRAEERSQDQQHEAERQAWWKERKELKRRIKRLKRRAKGDD